MSEIVDLPWSRTQWYIHMTYESRIANGLHKERILFSLIRSMWETICDAWACWSGWNFGPNSTEYPYSEIQFENTPPPPKMKIVRDLGTLTFQFENTPPKWKLLEILALWLFSLRIPPTPKWKLLEILALWLFSFRIPPSPPPENENCHRSWHFDFSVSESPPPPGNLNLGRSWQFKIIQFQNNWYQWQTMCGKLPHVETLSSPDNYLFIQQAKIQDADPNRETAPSALLVFVVICLVIITKWPPLSHRLLWFWWIES